MSFHILKVCRLCMSTSYLEDLFIEDGDTSLDSLIFFCFGIQVQQGDGLPALICKDCLKKVKMFNSFKQVCLKVDLKFKYMTGTLKHDITSKNMQEAFGNNLNVRYNNQQELVKINVSEKQELNLSNSITHKGYKNNMKLRDEMNYSVRNKKINNRNNSFQCEQCGLIFKLKTVLEKHMTIHTGIKPFTCKLCSKSFTRDENRMVHMRSHLGIKPYVCEICGSTSTKRQDLIRHMKIHSDERNYSCSVCNRNFKRSSDVISHMRTHTGLRPYKCKFCGKSYTSHSGLRKHYKTNCKKEIKYEN